MLWGGLTGDVELRRADDGSTRLRGRFTYGKPAVLSDGGRRGRPRKEIIAPRAFAYRVERPDEDIHLLLGHDYGQPLASRSTGTLTFEDSDDALSFVAIITRAIAATTHGANALAMIESGLSVGVSPGFRIPPERAVGEAERIKEEPMRPEEGMHGALIRTVLQALLYELSIVTRPAYPEAQVEARDWRAAEPAIARAPSHLRRWRL